MPQNTSQYLLPLSSVHSLSHSFLFFLPSFPTLTHFSPYLTLPPLRYTSFLFHLSVLPPLLLTNPPFPICSLLSNKSPYLTKPQSSPLIQTIRIHTRFISLQFHRPHLHLLLLSLLSPPYRIQIPNATKHIPISPTSIISKLPLPLFSLLSQLPSFPTLTHFSPYLTLPPLRYTSFPLSFISKYFLLYNSSLSLAPQVTTPLTFPSSSPLHPNTKKAGTPTDLFILLCYLKRLFNNLCYNTGTYCVTTFTDSETKTF